MVSRGEAADVMEAVAAEAGVLFPSAFIDCLIEHNAYNWLHLSCLVRLALCELHDRPLLARDLTLSLRRALVALTPLVKPAVFDSFHVSVHTGNCGGGLSGQRASEDGKFWTWNGDLSFTSPDPDDSDLHFNVNSLIFEAHHQKIRLDMDRVFLTTTG
jgi:hypothetical protein